MQQTPETFRASIRRRRVDSDASTIALLSKRELALELNISVWTLDRWVDAGRFPKPFYPQDNSPPRWRVHDIAAWIKKRKASRRRRPPLRGAAAAKSAKAKLIKRGVN